MGKGGCVGGHLVTTFYGSPVPLIGLYIAAATMVCFFLMTFDMVYGLFIRKRPFLPCKLFTMNAFTMTVLAIATKIPVDLTTSMPRVEDQLSKLMGTALMCTALGFYMPSLGTMGTSERYGNMAAMSVTMITMVVNVCIEMGTGVIFAFTVEHVIIMVCNLVLLLFMWSSAIGFRGLKDLVSVSSKLVFIEDTDDAEGLEGLKNLVAKFHELNYAVNPQTLLCVTSHHHVFGLSSALSSAVVLEAILKSIALKNVRLCSSSSGGGVSDYRWSIPIVIVAQFLTIAVGNFSIIYRWLSLLIHTEGIEGFRGKAKYFNLQIELEYLKVKTLPFRFLKKNLVFQVGIESIIDVLIRIQMGLYMYSSIFIGLPIYNVKKLILRVYIILFGRKFHDTTDDEMDKYNSLMFFVGGDETLWNWTIKMIKKDMMRWTNRYKGDNPTDHLIQLIISKCPPPHPSSASKLEGGFLFIRKLEATGEEFLQENVGADFMSFLKYGYRVSCVSVLVLLRILAELMPAASCGESSLMYNLLEEALNESFETIYFVDQNTIPSSSMLDEARWRSAKDVWVNWKNPNHWFRTKIISPVLIKSRSLIKKSEEESESEILHHVLEFLECPINAAKEILGHNFDDLGVQYLFANSLAEQHMILIATEFSIICKFIREEQNFGSVKDLFDFMEDCFAKMLYFTLHRLPMAIVKEIEGENGMEISEGRVRKAFKFLCKLELLWDTIEWSWPPKFDPKSHQANDAQSMTIGQAEPPRQTSNTITTTTADDGDDDTIREIGSDEIV